MSVGFSLSVLIATMADSPSDYADARSELSPQCEEGVIEAICDNRVEVLMTPRPPRQLFPTSETPNDREQTATSTDNGPSTPSTPSYLTRSKAQSEELLNLQDAEEDSQDIANTNVDSEEE